jgi:hypothetical protein
MPHAHFIFYSSSTLTSFTPLVTGTVASYTQPKSIYQSSFLVLWLDAQKQHAVQLYHQRVTIRASYMGLFCIYVNMRVPCAGQYHKIRHQLANLFI